MESITRIILNTWEEEVCHAKEVDEKEKHEEQDGKEEEAYTYNV